MKKILSVLVSFTLIASALPVYAAEATLGSSATVTSTAAATVFTRTLGLGAMGQDVQALKKILNLELGLTDSSNVYSATTASGVSALQEKYAVEILIPNGLSAGTGFVGQATLTKLSSLAAKYGITLSQFANVDVTTKQIFDQTLSLGSSGTEVSLLKNVLSSNLGITLSSTNIVDQATVDAINKFQLKYASAILTPNGLTTPTGTVGPSTRKQLNLLLQSTLASTSTGTTVASNTTVGQQTSSISTGAQLGQTTLYTSGVSGNSSTSLCPIYTYTYGSWGACSRTTNTQTRTVTVTTIGQATCPYQNAPQQAATQSCTPPPLPTCSGSQNISFGGYIGTEGICANGFAWTSIDFKEGVRYTDSSGECKPSGELRLIYPAPIGFQNFSALPGGTFAAPDGLNVLGVATPVIAQCVLAGYGGFWGRLIDPLQTKFSQDGKF